MSFAAVNGRRPRGVNNDPPVPYTLAANGCWTWFTDPRAFFHDGYTCVGYITSTGRPGIAKYVHGTGGTTFDLVGSLFENDDHDNAAVMRLQDGRIAAFYSKHNDSSGFRYRLSTSADDISAFDAEVQVSPSGEQVGYSNLHYLSSTGKYYNHYRRNLGPTYGQATSDFSTWDTSRTWISNGAQRPYIKSVSNGVDRIDFLFTSGHPNETVNHLYHAYMLIVAGVETWYKSDGTLIGTSGATGATATQIWDGSTAAGESWSWDIAYGDDGHPRVLFAVFPSTTDHRYRMGRWTGSAWTTAEVTTGGQYLYATEANYSGGMCFDSQDTDIVYLSKEVGSAFELQEWRTTDSGATWAKHRDITSGSASGQRNCRPYSPRNHDGRACVVWWSGTYTSFTSFSTAVKAVASY